MKDTKHNAGDMGGDNLMAAIIVLKTDAGDENEIENFYSI